MNVSFGLIHFSVLEEILGTVRQRSLLITNKSIRRQIWSMRGRRSSVYPSSWRGGADLPTHLNGHWSPHDVFCVIHMKEVFPQPCISLLTTCLNTHKSSLSCFYLEGNSFQSCWRKHTARPEHVYYVISFPAKHTATAKHTVQMLY